MGVIFNQFQGFGIDAIAQTAGCRTIGKNMPQMGITGIAHDFYPDHPIGSVFFVLNGIFLDRLGKTGPTGPGIEFDGGVKQRGPATDAGISSRFVHTAESPGMRGFGTLPTGDAILFWGQGSLPFLLRLLYPQIGLGISLVGEMHNVFPV
jgi:hypothetical protein